jgi:hypothetical protein
MIVQQAGQGGQSTRRYRRGVAGCRGVLIVALAGCVVLVAGCREDEQDRPLVYDKGTYQGPADEKLDQDQIEALRQRAAGQRM